MPDNEMPAFVPFIPAPSTQPEPPKTEPAKAGKRPKRGKRKPPAAPTAPVPPAPPATKAPRKKRTTAAKPKASKRSPKFDLQTILAVASNLKEADMSAFEKMLGQLQDLGKTSRSRVLAALAKVFA